MQALEATALDQGVVGQHIAGGRVLDEDRGVGDGVEDRQQQGHTGEKGLEVGGAMLIEGLVQGCQGGVGHLLYLGLLCRPLRG
ncbi:hypothetical protein D3C72_2203330 [compost metagenome]